MTDEEAIAVLGREVARLTEVCNELTAALTDSTTELTHLRHTTGNLRITHNGTVRKLELMTKWEATAVELNELQAKRITELETWLKGRGFDPKTGMRF